jgi:putative lipoic acid-binding regulatory protein
MTEKTTSLAQQNSEEALTEQTLVEFPCDFLIKVMGETSETFAMTMLEVIREHEPNFDASKIEMRGSSSGRFISLSCSVYVESKPQLDAIYRALSTHPLVKFAL